ncbi:hypothetical protein ISF_05243 [Cordyceps fumosorosea ARSEF 2679]|uniref:Uncharacterized protein n=1 Tax=Cordyceps fumosorosea (strain ARSEF 2679) TaxID=1081104 RepID=A0A167V560_CORFA|nr:hypothetical protein ISF_05243 [Cordyceps fumosorosea ARSEF 2679]OAA62234.1 hypothetical protein ISF_05243 [Cordyceps fumosorosea ARSEF 2679]
MHLPAYLLAASLSTRPAPATRSLNERRQYPRPPLTPHHRGLSRQASRPPSIPTLERCSSTPKTDRTNHPQYRRQSVPPHPRTVAASAPSTYSTQRHSLQLYPPAALHPVLATAAASPLRPRGNHDRLVTPGLNHNTAFARITMPPGDRPRQPPSVVRAAANRPAPLTPKVAAKGAPVLGSLARRPQGTVATLANDVASPVSGFLATNVTPRTGHRQTRVESTNNTPTATPTPDNRVNGWDRDSPRPGGMGLTSSADSGLKASEMPPDANDTNKFFYASDAKNIQTPCQLRQPPPTVQKGPNFFYANAALSNGADRSAPSTPNPVPMLSPPNPNTQDSSTKFFYANGTPEMEPKPAFSNSNSNSVLSSGPRLALGGRPPLGSSATVVGVVQRPPSPLKHTSTPAPVLSPILRNAMPPASSQISPPSPATLNPEGQRGMRRVSIEAPPKPPRRQSRATGSPGPELQLPPKLTMSPNPSETVSPPASPGILQTSMTMASLLHAAEELQGSDDDPDILSEPQSPSKSHFSDSVNELVANARRERKVQDLEITNASLEAINRTLERQLRKQTAELRRYRRLSRSGRLSLTSAPNSRVVSEALTDPPVDLSDLSEHEQSEEEEEEFDDSIEESDLSMNDTASMSAISISAMRRKRDEKRLQLDLTKHQELLIDSQKMNQSIKRCLSWTETLIKEGQKALEYHVRVSDVEFGGHILSPVDEDDYDLAFQDDDHHMARKEAASSSPLRAQPDRDSGIELPPGDDGS